MIKYWHSELTMNGSNSHIVYGPQITTNLEGISLGELFFKSLKEKDPLEILMVDCSTGEKISRGKCLQSTLKLARILQDFGITKNDGLAVISTNTWKILISVISSFYIGVSISPINSNSSEGDLLHYLKIIKPKIIFISKNVLDKIRAIKNELSWLKYVIIFNGDALQDGEIYFDDLLSEQIDFNYLKIHNEVIEDCIILFSSGTTGFPKGVVYSSENLKIFNYYCDPDILAVNENSILLGLLPMFHLFGLLTALICVLHGKRCILLESFKPDVFLRSIQEYKITKLIIVPPMILFLDQSPLVAKYDLTSVEEIICGAAPLGIELEEAVSQRLNIKIRQIYGLTETIGISTTPHNVHKPGSIGKVIAGVQLKIVDPTSWKIRRAYETGEICVKGPAVMKGYKNNEIETRNIFDSERYLHTGDLGYFDEEGYLYVVDRIKEIIKYKGFQVPPAQLEDLLLKHPAIKDAGVIGRVDERAGELPTAFIVKKSDEEITEEEIIAYIAGKVSVEKQLHGGVIFINEIPKSASGKILRRKLNKML